MNATINDIKCLVDSAEYNRLLEKLQKKIEITLLNDVSDVEFEDDYDDTKKAGLDINNLRDVFIYD